MKIYKYSLYILLFILFSNSCNSKKTNNKQVITKKDSIPVWIANSKNTSLEIYERKKELLKAYQLVKANKTNTKSLKNFYLDIIDVLNEVVEFDLDYGGTIQKNNLQGYRYLHKNDDGLSLYETNMFYINENLYSFSYYNENGLNKIDVNILLQDSLNFEYCFSQTGNYVLTQTVWFLGCAYSFEKNIVVREDLDISITPDFVWCNEFPVELTVESNFPVSSYLWNTGATTSTLEIETTGEYFIEVSDGICMASDTINFVKMEDESCPLDLKIPNVFTPDGDGLNDLFGPVDGEYYEMIRIIIFNRWGQKVYDGKNPWDGNLENKPSPSDVYVFRMEYLNLLNDEMEEVIGEVTLVR